MNAVRKNLFVLALALALALVSVSCGMFRDFETPCGDEDFHPIENGNDAKIDYVLSSLTYHAPSKDHVETPCVIVDKVKKAFELYESVEEFPYQFDFKGFYNPSFEPVSDRPLIKVDLTGTTIEFPSAARTGVTGIKGGLSNYKGANINLNTTEGLHALSFQSIIHELGHALGLRHVPNNASPMTCGDPIWKNDEYFHFSLQDRASLTQNWAILDDYYEVYGSVSGSRVQGHSSYYVYLVDIETGVTFSALTGPDYDYAQSTSESYAFRIGVPANLISTGVLSGDFKIFVKGFELESLDITDPLIMPSWYVNDVSSTLDPAAATTITLNAESRGANVILLPIESRNTFSMFWASRLVEEDTPASFLLPGETGRILFNYVAADLESATFFGTAPGATFSNFRKGRDIVLDRPLTNAYMADITVSTTAVPGPRLVRLVDYDGVENYSLVGIEVLSGKMPVSLKATSNEDQFSGKFNFNRLDANYWKNE